MSFLTKYDAKIQSAPKKTKGVDPITSFAKAAYKEADRIKAGGLGNTSSWVKNVHGEYQVTLKSGVRPLPIKDGGNVACFTEKNAVIDYLKDAAQAAQNGEFNQLFAAVKLAVKPRKPKTPVE